MRNDSGQFVKGKTGNPAGRPKKERELRYYEIMQSKCTFKEWGDICQKAVDQAKRGDTSARKFLADYLLGPPVQRLDVDHSGEITTKVTDAEYNRAISTLANAIRKSVPDEGTGSDGVMDTTE